MTLVEPNDGNRRRASSADVATLAGVSRATVSRCFTEGASVKSKTREKVLAAARTLGYEPNLLARMLNKQESDIVAVLTSDFANPFQPALMEALTGRMRSQGLTPLLLKGESAAESADEMIQLALSYRVAAIVVTVLNASERMIARCFEANVPLIFLNRVAEDTPAISVCSNSRSGAQRVAEVLVEAGTTRIGMISGQTGSWMNSMRRGGFRQRLDELGFDVLGHIQGNFSYESGRMAALSMMDSHPRLDAIYACNDAMALGAMDAIRFDRGAKVPDDIAVIGFDDVPVAAWGAYRLTTIHQPVGQMVEQTLDILLNPDRGMALSGQVFLYEGHLVQRLSAPKVALRDGERDGTSLLPDHTTIQGSSE